MARIRNVTFGLLLTILGSVQAKSQNVEGDFEGRIWSSVRTYALVKLTVRCRITNGASTSSSYSESGTGFVVGGRYIFTARHLLLACVKGQYVSEDPRASVGTDLKRAAEDATQDVSITFSDRADHEQVTSLTTATISENADFGFLDVPASIGSRPSLCLAPSLRFEPQSHVTFYGFGLNTTPRARSGSIEVAETADHMTLLRVTAGPGWSGSPVVDKSGFVRGLVIQGLGDTEVVLPLSFVRQSFDNLNVIAPESYKEPDLDPNEAFSACSSSNASQVAKSGPVTIPIVSSWVGGGWDPDRFCNSEIERLRSSYRLAEFSKSDLGEENNKDWLGQVHYKYHCTITIRPHEPASSPTTDIKARSSSCGPRNLDTDPVVCPIR